MGAKGRQTGSLTLARYTDVHGRAHRVVLRGRLVLDVARREPARVVALLGEGEGEPQARALLDGSGIDEGYLVRAAREPRPFVRELRADDVEHGAPADDADSKAEDAADEPPLAA
jgi:hypothetical protein